jgi:hypothetical protein
MTAIESKKNLIRRLRNNDDIVKSLKLLAYDQLKRAKQYPARSSLRSLKEKHARELLPIGGEFWPTGYGQLASRTDARSLQPPKQSLQLPEKARNPDRRGLPRSNPDTPVLPDFGIVRTCPMFF